MSLHTSSSYKILFFSSSFVFLVVFLYIHMADSAPHTREPSVFVFLTIHVGSGDDGKPGPAPASKAAIEALPTIKVVESGKDCSICLEEFQIEGEAREMPCKHVFHSNCVQKWLRIHGSCPVCRYLMPAEENRGIGGVDDGGEEGGLASLGERNIVLGIVLASLMAMAGSGRRAEQSDSGQVAEADFSAEETDFD